MSHHLRLVSDNSGRFPPTEKLVRQLNSKRVAKLREIALKNRAIRKLPDTAPVANAAGGNAKLARRRRGAAKAFDDLTDSHVRSHEKPIYSCGLKKSSGLNLEMISVPHCGKIKGMATNPDRFETPNPRSVSAISDRLRRTREALGLKPIELCRRTGIAPNTYSQWENGKGRPELDKAILLCDAFNVTLDWIYLGKQAGLPNELATNISSGFRQVV